MRIVIDIPEGTYDLIKHNVQAQRAFENAYYAIRRGTVLPKRHGRLIDADKFKKYFQESMADTAPLFRTQKYKALAEMVTKGICKDLDDAPVVVEADKEVDDGRSDERP